MTLSLSLSLLTCLALCSASANAGFLSVDAAEDAAAATSATGKSLMLHSVAQGETTGATTGTQHQARGMEGGKSLEGLVEPGERGRREGGGEKTPLMLIETGVTVGAASWTTKSEGSLSLCS